MSEVTIESARSKRHIDYSKMTDGWNQMKLESATISSLARGLEKIGFGKLSDIYFDLIMPLSLERKLSNMKDIIDEANKQAQQHENSRQWKKLVDTCCSLIYLAERFDMEKDPSGPQAVAVCLEYLCRLRHEADLQRQEGRSEAELIAQLENLEGTLTSKMGQWEGSVVFLGIKNSLAERTRGYSTTFDMLIGATPDATRMFPESFNILDEHREVMRANHSRLSWSSEKLGKVDNFGWSPFHYAANWQLNDANFLFDSICSADVFGPRDFMGRTPLHHACLKGNKRVVSLLLTRDTPIEVAGYDGITPIHCAVSSGSLSILEKLVEQVEEHSKHGRESASHVDRNGRLPIHWAAAQGRMDLVRLLKGDINRTDRYGWTCIHLAVLYKNDSLLECIVKELSADINLRDYHSRTPLQLAMEVQSWEAFGVLIQAGAQIDVQGKDGSSLLHIAVGQMETAETGITQIVIAKLIDAGADVNATDSEGRTALLLAAKNGMTDAATLLIDRGADVSVKTKDKRTALHMAVRSRSITDKLLEHGAFIDAKDIKGCTPLYLASKEGTAEAAALLIDRGADVAIAAEDGRTPLHMALSRGKDGLEIAKRLLNYVPDVGGHNPYVNAMAKDNATPLHVAAEYGPLEAVKMLLHLGADINQTDEFGQTALLIAIYNENWDIANCLLEDGADVKADSRVGYTPLLGAVMGDQEHIVEQLLRRGANVEAVNHDGYSSIHLAVAQKNTTIIRRLLDAGAKINAVAESLCETPLHVAVRTGNSEVVRILLEKKADTKPLNAFHFTALQVAVFCGYLDIVKEFVKHDQIPASTAPKAVLQRGEHGDIPLHSLCRWSWKKEVSGRVFEILEELLSVATDIDMINTLNDEGLTPLDLARSTMGGHPALVEKLTEKGAKPSDKEPSEEPLVPGPSLDV